MELIHICLFCKCHLFYSARSLLNSTEMIHLTKSCRLDSYTILNLIWQTIVYKIGHLITCFCE